MGLFFRITQYSVNAHNARTLTPMKTHTQTLPLYEHLPRLSQQILEIDEITTGASSSMETSAITKTTHVVISWNIRSHRESNLGLEVLLRLL
jgi:hypothetical protein